MGVCTRGAWYECVWECVHIERGVSVYGRGACYERVEQSVLFESKQHRILSLHV